jgi:hypothetical protein
LRMGHMIAEKPIDRIVISTIEKSSYGGLFTDIERTKLAVDTYLPERCRPHAETGGRGGCRRGRRANRQATLAVVERWNAERSPLWSPTIHCAVTTGTPWLDVYCPGCRTSKAIDIRTLDRHALASVGSLVLGLRCSWCPGDAPMPVLTGHHALPPAAKWRKSMPVEFLHGRPLSAEELEMIRRQIEEGYDNITEVDAEIRGIVARNWPHLLSKLSSEDE